MKVYQRRIGLSRPSKQSWLLVSLAGSGLNLSSCRYSHSRLCQESCLSWWDCCNCIQCYPPFVQSAACSGCLCLLLHLSAVCNNEPPLHALNVKPYACICSQAPILMEPNVTDKVQEAYNALLTLAHGACSEPGTAIPTRFSNFKLANASDVKQASMPGMHLCVCVIACSTCCTCY